MRLRVMGLILNFSLLVAAFVYGVSTLSDPFPDSRSSKAAFWSLYAIALLGWCKAVYDEVQLQKNAREHLAERKQDKRFQDRSLQADDFIIESTTKIDATLKDFIAIQKDVYAARYPFGYIMFGTDDLVPFGAMRTDRFYRGLKVRMDTNWNAARVEVKNNVADVHFKNVTFTIIREHGKTTEIIENEMLATVALEEGEQVKTFPIEDMECVLEVVDAKASKPTFVLGFRKTAKQAPYVIAGNQPGTFSSKILQKDDPNLTPEQKEVFEGHDGIPKSITDGPWIEIQHHGGMSAPEEEDEKNVLFRSNIVDIVPPPVRQFPYLRIIDASNDAKTRICFASHDVSGVPVKRVSMLPLFEVRKQLQEGRTLEQALAQVGKTWVLQPPSEPATCQLDDFPLPAKLQKELYEIRLFQDRLRTVQFALIGHDNAGRYLIAVRVYEVLSEEGSKIKLKPKPELSHTAKEVQLVNGTVPYIDAPETMNPGYEVVSE